MRTHPTAIGAAVMLGLEALGIVALAVWQLAAVAGGDTASLPSALALLVLTVVGAVAVGAFAVAVWRGQSWGRSGGVVTQLLILAVALGAATGVYAAPLLGLELALPAVLTLVLLVLVSRRAAPRRGSDASDADE